MFENKKFTLYLEQTYGHVHTKMQQTCGENKLMLEETKLQRNTHFSKYFFSNSVKYISMDYRFNLVLVILSQIW